MKTEDILRTKQIVREVLEEDIRSRNNDLWLLLQVWQKKQQIKIYIDYTDLYKMIPAETITRVRREIQNRDCDLLPTDPNVLVRRQVKEEVIRKYYANDNRLLLEWQNLKYGVN